MNKKIRRALLIVLSFAVVACAKKPARAASATATPVTVSVTRIVLGSAVTATNEISAPLDVFDRFDPIFAALDMRGSGPVTLTAKWSHYYDNGTRLALIGDSSQTVTVNDTATGVFRVENPGGWINGDYQIEIFLNGEPVGTRRFSVK
jgi:hypothetical protein